MCIIIINNLLINLCVFNVICSAMHTHDIALYSDQFKIRERLLYTAKEVIIKKVTQLRIMLTTNQVEESEKNEI